MADILGKALAICNPTALVRSVRYPPISVVCHHLQRDRSLRCKRQWGSGSLDNVRPHLGTLHPVVMALKGHRFAAEQTIHHMDEFPEALHPLWRLPSLDTRHARIKRRPTGADGQLQAAARHVVDRQCLARQDGRIPERDRCDQGTEANTLCAGGECGQERPPLEPRFYRSVGVDEVVAVPGNVISRLLQSLPLLGEDGPGEVWQRNSSESRS